MKYNFNVKRLRNKVQIDIDKWLYPSESVLQIQKINGRSHITYITEAQFVGEELKEVKKDDYILLSKVSCGVGTSPTAYYTIDKNRYFDVPAEQIMGVFQDHVIDIIHLKMMPHTLLFERIKKAQDSVLAIEEKDTMLGKVVKVGENSKVKTDDVIAVRDNVSTPIKFGDKEYFAIEDKFVVGVLDSNYSIDSMNLINEYIIMKPYISKNVLNSTVLETPEINYDDLDYSDIENRNLFKVCYADKSLNVEKGDILLLNRDFTNYMYYNNEKFFVINGKKWISGKIIERDKQCN